LAVEELNAMRMDNRSSGGYVSKAMEQEQDIAITQLDLSNKIYAKSKDLTEQ
jgi:hypothetical protein